MLLVDKPVGPTSHDVVARVRRTLGQQRIGHTGTLDPRASGLLVLVLGRATKLAAALTAGRKTYDATIRLGVRTTTDDSEGEPIGPALPVRATGGEIEAALSRFRGTIAQVPPAHSAKKVGGERAYTLARRAAAVELRPVPVTIHALDLVERHGDDLHVRVTAGSGFYVRSLARDLGEALGCGGHLAALRRTASGPFAVADAIGLGEAERLGRELASRVIPPAAALPDLEAVSLTETGCRRARHGNAVGPEDIVGTGVAVGRAQALVRLLSPEGHLLALARPQGGALHPVTVLG